MGWALSDTLKAVDTSNAAFQMALKNRPLDGELLFHSDLGVQYACIEFRDQLKELPVLQSMSRQGNCRFGGPMGQCRGRKLFQNTEM